MRLGALACSRTSAFSKRSTRMVFTGIVQGKAKVERIVRKENFSSLALQFPPDKVESCEIGASVAINGTCLTIVKQDGPVLHFDVIGETLDKTNLGELVQGSHANFERAARFGDEIGGHVVSGHVHTKGEIAEVEETANNVRYRIEAPPAWVKYIMPKGYVAVDGCSLTVGEVQGGGFNVYLIPETLRVTTLAGKKQGDFVNLEVDGQTQTIVDTIERYLDQRQAA